MSGVTYIIGKLRRELESIPKGGMHVGMPKVTVYCSDLRYALDQLEILSQGSSPGFDNKGVTTSGKDRTE